MKIIVVILLISLVRAELKLSQNLIQKQRPEVLFENAVPENVA